MSIYFVDDGFEYYLAKAETPEDALGLLGLSEAQVAEVSKRGSELRSWALGFQERPTQADYAAIDAFIYKDALVVCLR